MDFKSINPYTNKEVGSFKAHNNEEVAGILEKSAKAFKTWSREPLSNRTELIKNAAQILRENAEDYAQMITAEMGKPISESLAEVNKCALVCDYYAENAPAFLATENIKTDAAQSFVRYDPLGTVFAIMPWNFPFWQVFRFAAPTLTAGNTAILKHSSNVFGCALKIEEVFTKAGYPEGVFQNLIVHHDQTENVMAHDTVKAVSLTGSEMAGASVAQIAAKYIKKSLLELGGNNSLIVWEDADIDQAVKTAVTARMLNCGQSCIAAKRFILLPGIYDEFVSKFTEAVSKLKAGDTMDKATQIGPMARKDLADQLNQQVKSSVDQGAKLLLGGNQKDCFHEPTILSNVEPGMSAFDEETFGPLAAIIKAKDINDAFRLSELSKYGLGTTVFTKDIAKALEMADRVSDGAYFVNELVKSDPRLPFGGTKRSGYGRELAKEGIREFVNIKTVYVGGA